MDEKWIKDSETNIEDIIGVIFDFNGTMFFDSKYHIKAWTSYVEELTGGPVAKKDVEQHIIGKSGKNIVEYFLGYELNDDMVEQFCEEKESIYRNLCMQNKEDLKLAPGLEKFLDFLTEHNVPRTVSSSAPLSNIMFYFEVFDLYRWFDPEKMVYHDKRMRDKPFPDMYIVASRMLNKKPEQCLVFEDSVTGITAAKNAGVKHVVAIKGDNPNLSVDGFDCVKAVIQDYTALDKNLVL